MMHSSDVTKLLEPFGFEVHTGPEGEEAYAAEQLGVRMLLVSASDPNRAPATSAEEVLLVLGGANEERPAVALHFHSIVDLTASLMRGHQVIDPGSVVGPGGDA